MYGQGNIAPQFGHTPRTSAPLYQQQPPLPSSLPFQQGVQAAQTPLIQHGSSLGSSVYQHTPSVSMQQGPPVPVPVPLSGMLSLGQSYLNPPPQMPLSVPNNYTYAHQNPHWQQSAQHIPQPLSFRPTSSGSSCSETLQSSSVPAQVSLPSHGQALLKGPLLQVNGDSQALQHTQSLPPPPPPPRPLLASNFYMPTAQFGSFVHSKAQSSEIPVLIPPPPPPLPPPPPSSPPGLPPLPPSSPSPASSPISKISLPSNVEKCSSPDATESLVDRLSDASKNNDLLNPGSIGSLLDFELHEKHQQSNSISKQLESKSSTEPGGLSVTVLPHSPAESDMDMEDDITLPEEEQSTFKSVKVLTHEIVSVSDEVAKEEQSHAVQSATQEGLTLVKGYDPFNSGGSYSKIDHVVLKPNETVKCSLDSNVQNPADLNIGASPFRLLQDYASDDDLSIEVANVLEVSPDIKSHSVCLDGAVFHSETDVGTKPCSVSNVVKSVSILDKACSLSMQTIALELPVESDNIGTVNGEKNVPTYVVGEGIGNSLGIKESTGESISKKAFQKKDPSTSPDAVTASDSGKLITENKEIKVDEFGRLVREDYSNSDSDDSSYLRRRAKRVRSRSRSQSPHGRRRRRWSRPRRKRVNYSRSRSRSPRKRRSRSRSPYRHGGEQGDRLRRDKGRFPQCFDFLRGKCYRGANCRYLHHESDRDDRSRNYKGKLSETPLTSKSHDFPEDNIIAASKSTVYDHESKTETVLRAKDTSIDNLAHSLVGMADEEKAMTFKREKEQHYVSYQDDKTSVTAVIESGRSTEVNGEVQEKRNIEEKIVNPHLIEQSFTGLGSEADADQFPRDTSLRETSSSVNLIDQQSQPHRSDLLLPRPDPKPQAMIYSSIPDYSSGQMSSTIPSTIPKSEPHQNHISLVQPFPSENDSVQSLASKGLSTPISHQSSHFLPQAPAHLQGMYTYSAAQLPGNHSSVAFVAPYNFSSQMDNFSPHEPTLTQNNLQAVMPFNSWSSLPPPPPLLPPKHVSASNDSTLNAANALRGLPLLQFQQQLMHLRNEFPSQTIAGSRPAESHVHSEVCESQHVTYSPKLDSDQSQYGISNQRNRHPVGSGPIAEGQMMQPLPEGLISSNSFTQRNMHSIHVSLSRESPKRRAHTLPEGNLPAPEGVSQFSESHMFPQPFSHGMQYPVTDSVSVAMGDAARFNSTVSRYTSDFLDMKQTSHVSDLGVSRIMNHHYNPYASTFDRPLLSMFSSSYINQEKEMPCSNNYSSQYKSTHVPVDAHDSGSLGSKNINPTSNSTLAVERNLYRSGGDQYDPIFDSIEPSSNSFRRLDFAQKPETADDSDILPRLSGSIKPLDVKKNKKQKEAAAISTSISSENEECGETADAEVGAVDNESLSCPTDEVNTAFGEVEIDQVKTSVKSKKKKKSKDSKSMKLFRIALASFVKDVLKPSWRQGNMSKEAFKTIVKKTVDKVSGAMKSHHVPRSQAKINQYIDSSQRKLTKLVMGYVDKYVKV